MRKDTEGDTRSDAEDVMCKGIEGHPRKSNAARRALVLVAGGALLVTGVALLVLPGPGLLLVLAGLLVLSREFPFFARYVDPVRDRALRAAADSVASPLRLAVSALAGVGLIAAGLVWGLRPRLPFGGWAAGTGLMLSGLILLALLVWSHRRARRTRSDHRTHTDTETSPVHTG
ncbi:PGPGW domain-containing protein [Streptomyces sp. NPDC090106]|uniref:PGPGW domain-containing protein n=1 Tax=Streptomyces sp. NPDC090106 TaxID=3365946 RepID=UPI0037FC58DC